jgi:fermentation-respiration switch protein FrsA (DUF1100 family)
MKKKIISLLLALCMALTLVTAAFADDTAVTAAPVASATLPFTDVASGSWYYDAVTYVYQNKLFSGVTGTTFEPATPMTRAMLVSVLYSQAGKPAVTGADSTLWYGSALKWAKDNKISDGTNMSAPVTREQLVTILYSYAQLKCYDTTQGGMAVREFADYSTVSSYALAAMQWAVNAGMVKGTNNKLMPKANATRAQVATMLYHFFSENKAAYTESVVTVKSADGTEIPATVTVPTNVPAGGCAGVVMLHGTGSSRDEAGNGYKTAAPILAVKYGIATIRIDFRGNGDSKADYMQYTFKTAVEDAVAAANYLGKLESVNANKLGVMGWSQGGTDALLAAGQHPEIFKCVVTWAGAPDLSDMLTPADYAAAQKDGYFVMKFDWRSDLKVSLQWCNDVKTTDVLKVFKDGYTGPVLAIAGKKDTTVDPTWSTKIVAASSNSASATHFIDDMDHTFNVFTETDLHSLMNAVNATGAYFQTNLAK